MCRAGITTHDKQFCNMFALRYNDDPYPDIPSNLPALCRSFNLKNRIINKHFTGTFVNICCFVQG